MRFLIYSLNYEPELTGIGKYNSELAYSLCEFGINVTAVVGYPYYPEWRVAKGYNNKHYSHEILNNISLIRCPIFIPSKVSTVKRIIHLISFSLTSGLALLTQKVKKPNVIFLVQPSLFCAPMALVYAKMTGAFSIMHIQDFEIDAMFELGLKKKRKGLFSKLVYTLERKILQQFDLVTTISSSMLEKAYEKGVEREKLYLLPNWASLTNHKDLVDSRMREEWGFEDSDKIVLYAGNMGEKQGLETILDAAAYFQSLSEIKFVMVGSGANEQNLKKYAKDRNLKNTFFFPLQPKERLGEMLCTADIHLVTQKAGVSDLVLPSKLTNILAVGGHAIVTAEKDTELFRIAETYKGIYSTIEPESTVALINALNQLIESELTSKNSVAMKYAQEHLDKHKIVERFVDILKIRVG